MEPQKFKNRKYKVGGTRNIEILKQDFLSKNYMMIKYPYKKATESGFVKLIEWIPKQNRYLPKFILRWDLNKQTVDVDLYVNGKIRNDLWRKHGYSGHHPVRCKNMAGRVFKIDIKTPKELVFRGLVKIAVTHELQLKNSIGLNDKLKIN